MTTIHEERKTVVGVVGEEHARRYRLLFAALAKLYPVVFRTVTCPGAEVVDGLIFLDGNMARAAAAANQGRPSFVVLESRPADGKPAAEAIRFGGSDLVADCLQNQVMPDDEARLAGQLPHDPQDEVLASVNGLPVWTSKPCERGHYQVVAMSLPCLRSGTFLFQHLNRDRFFRLLPLMNFLRQLVEGVDWESPVLPACFIFDDPSLYWRSYGFLNYRRLAEHAKKYSYFVSVATVPLDTWRVSRSVAATFRSYRPQLSLMIHGNNHTFRELLFNGDNQSGLQLAAQALRRMERFKLKHQLDYAKIMEAPHAAIALELFPNLLALGYEAALATTELLVQYNPQGKWAATVGMHKAEMLGGGLPVIPRIKMTTRWKNDVLLAAFLRQPIVIAGHHHDAARELELLKQISEVVNGLRDARWSEPHGVLNSNYQSRLDGDVMSVRMYSRRVSIPIPPRTRFLVVNRPWLSAENGETIRIVSDTSRVLFSEPSSGMTDLIAVEDANRLEVTSEISAPFSISEISSPSLPLWPIARKLMTEFCDRLSPIMSFTNRLHRPGKTASSKHPVE